MVLIVKVPFINGLGKTDGCEKAGDLILECLKNEIHSNEKGEAVEFDKLVVDGIQLDNGNVEEANELIYRGGFEIFKKKEGVVFLGGDHSVSYPLTRAFFDSCSEKDRQACLIVFDAHTDLMEPMKEPTHEEWLRKIIDSGFPAENVLLIGVRNLWKSELDFIKEKRIQMISVNSIQDDIDNIADTIMEFAGSRETYVSIDVDVVDPVFVPGTGYQEPGGLSSRELIYIIQRLNKIKNLRAVDLVEINPEKDKNNLTVKFGAKILGELV